MRISFLVVLAFFSLRSAAQSDSPNAMLHRDPRVDMLIKKQMQINEETTRDSRRAMPGYRVQVMNTNNRNEAVSAKTKIYQLYPEQKVYLMYQSPYYRLRVGNFKTRAEAESFLRSLSNQFGTGVTIVRDVIEVKPEKLMPDSLE
jgi:SPOR domain